MGPHGDFAEAFRLPLESLQWNWGEAYEIGVNADGWWAKRRDGQGQTLRALNADALRDAILADYTVRPVPRDADTL